MPFNWADEADADGTEEVDYFYGFQGDHRAEVCQGCKAVLEKFKERRNDVVDMSGYASEQAKIGYIGIPAFARHMHEIDFSEREKEPERMFTPPVHVLSLKRLSIVEAFKKEGIFLFPIRLIACDSELRSSETCEGCAVYEFLPRQFKIFDQIEKWSESTAGATNPFAGLQPTDMLTTHSEMLIMDIGHHARANRALSPDPVFNDDIYWGDLDSRYVLMIGELDIAQASISEMRARFVDGRTRLYFKDPVLVLAFMVFTTYIFSHVTDYVPHISIGGHGSLPANRIREYATVSKGNVVTLAAPGFVVADMAASGAPKGTTESTCDEGLWHSVPIRLEGPKVITGPVVRLDDPAGVRYEEGDQFMDIDIQPFHMMLCGAFQRGEEDNVGRNIMKAMLPLSMSYFRKLVLDEVPAYGDGGDVRSIRDIMFRLESLMERATPSGYFRLNAKCCGSHPSYELIYPARYRFLMTTLNYEKTMINMLNKSGSGENGASRARETSAEGSRAPKRPTLLGFLLQVNEKREIPEMLKVPNEKIEAIVECAGLGEAPAPSVFSSSLMTVFYMAYLDQHYDVKCNVIVGKLKRGTSVTGVVAEVLRAITGRDGKDPAKVMLGEAKEETETVQAAEFGFGFTMAENTLEKTTDELNDSSSNLQLYGTVEADPERGRKLQKLRTTYLAIMDALGLLGIARTMKTEVVEAGFSGGGAGSVNRGLMWGDASYVAGAVLCLAVAAASSMAGSISASVRG